MNLHALRAAGILLALLLFAEFLYAQETSEAGESSCESTIIASVPSRPTVSNGTDTTQCGVLELEYGLERQWQGEGVRNDDFSGGLRFGITPRLDFHWASADFLGVSDAAGTHRGFGDTWLGLKYRLSRQSRYVPSFGMFYSAKVPSASAVLGGSGRVDHAISVLVSKDVRRLHFDFNVIPQLAGRPGTSGFDHNTGFPLSSSLPLSKRFSLVTEGYGYTALNSATLAWASTMAGVTYQVKPRLLLDSGFDVGVTPYAPRQRVYFGVTYAVANLYSRMRPGR